jgi:hypothetical protein
MQQKYIVFITSVMGWFLQMSPGLDRCHMQDSNSLCSHAHLCYSLLLELFPSASFVNSADQCRTLVSLRGPGRQK